MSRPIEYNKTKVLGSAMRTFWKLGYDATTMKELVAITGLNTRTMYKLFDSKQGIFHAALEWYYDTMVLDAFTELQNGIGINAIEKYIQRAVIGYELSMGCMFSNTVSDRYNICENSLLFVDDFFNKLESVFEEKLKYANENESFKGNPSNTATKLIIMLQGASIYTKNKQPAEITSILYDEIISILRN